MVAPEFFQTQNNLNIAKWKYYARPVTDGQANILPDAHGIPLTKSTG